MSGVNQSGGAQLRVGLFGIGLDVYWPQFTGLEQRLIGYVGETEKKLAARIKKLGALLGMRVEQVC